MDPNWRDDNRMNLLEAIKSGRPFKRKVWDNDQWRTAPNPNENKEHYGERLCDIVAQDWELKPAEPDYLIHRVGYTVWQAVKPEWDGIRLVDERLVEKIVADLDFITNKMGMDKRDSIIEYRKWVPKK